MFASPSWAFVIIFSVSAALRLMFLYTIPLDPMWTLATENGAVGYTLATHGAYADPYLLATGPTAHPVPVFTGFMALLYSWFGVSMTAEYVRCAVSAVGFSALYGSLPWVGVRLGVPLQAGWIGGVAGALTPFHRPGTLGEEFVGLALGLLLVVFLRPVSVVAAAGLGLVWGALFHLAPPLLLVFVGVAGFRWRERATLAMVVGAALACTPWMWRNYQVFGEWMFVRSNLGLELRMGYDTVRHPRENKAEAAKVLAMGEAAYMRAARSEALWWMRTHPREFAGKVVGRVGSMWWGWAQETPVTVGTALVTAMAIAGGWLWWPRWTRAQRFAWLWPLAAYPFVYYFTIYMPRYRIPIDGLMLLLAGAGVWAGITWARGEPRGTWPARSASG